MDYNESSTKASENLDKITDNMSYQSAALKGIGYALLAIAAALRELAPKK